MVRRAALLLVAALAATAALVPAASAVTAKRYYAIGDSVMIDAATPLRASLPGISINAATSRQVDDGIAILRKKKSAHTIGGTTVFGLGTNGTLSTAQLKQIVALTAGHKLVMVSTHCSHCSWTSANNRVITSLCTKAHHCWIAHFEAHARAHPEWFGDDGVHMPLNGTGAKAYASYVRAACHNARVDA